MNNFTPFPKLDTENLLLRRIDESDINDLYEMRKDPSMIEYTDSKLDESKDETKAYIDKMNQGLDASKWIIWAMEDKVSKKLIGTISIWNINSDLKSAELGYGIIPSYQGKGLMREALLCVCNFGFRVMGLKVLEAYTEEENAKSIKLLERCNFVMADRVDDEGYYSKRVYHMLVYRLEKNMLY